MPELLLPKNATPRERAIEALNAERHPFPHELIRALRDPWSCPEHLLPFLAHDLSVDYWRNDWPVLRQRSVIARSIALHRRKGTLWSMREAADLADARLVDHKTPPEGYFAAPDLSKEEIDAYIELHPKVRILFASERGTWSDVDGWVSDNGFVEEATVGVYDGEALYGRKAVYSHRGVERPLRLAVLQADIASRAGVQIESVFIPGQGAAFSHADEFAADDSFADAFDDPPRSYTYALPRDYVHDASRLELTRVPVGFSPRDMRYRRESEKGLDTAPTIFAGDYAGEGFAGVNDALFLLADVLRLVDPSISSPLVNSGGFADHSRVGFPPHTAELQVDWIMKAPPRSAIFAGSDFVGDAPAPPRDEARMEEVLDAIMATKRATDKVLVTFQLRRARTLADGFRLDDSARLDEDVPFNL